MMEERLFQQGDLRSQLQQKRQDLLREIDNYKVEYILGIDLQELTNYLLDKFRLVIPVLIEKEIKTSGNETQMDISKDPTKAAFCRGGPVYKTGTEVHFYIPFEGDKELFLYQPSTYKGLLPTAIVKDSELVVSKKTTDSNPNPVKEDFMQDLESIKIHLDFVKKQVDDYNNELKNLIGSRIKARQEELKAGQDLVANLGFKLKRREDAPETYRVPLVRKKLKIQPTVTRNPTLQEPIFDLSDYENILSIISNMSLVMERSPTAFATMDEELIRQHFLLQLNGQYEGGATGETFNYTGKTDILVRVNGKNLFIGECKFWHGEKELLKTINQILGYTCWRDTKTAILIFNRNKDLSNVLEQIPSIIKKHDNYIKTIDYDSETGFRYEFHHNDDKNRKLLLTILVFEVPLINAEGVKK